MITLATLNMLLNGDGEAKLFHKPHLGSIESKVESGNNASLTDLLPDFNAKGNWDERPDEVQLKKFNVVLTNPPFGEDRAFRPANEHERQVIETYQTWHLARKTTEEEDATTTTARGRQPKKSGKSREALDLGIVFHRMRFIVWPRMGVWASCCLIPLPPSTPMRACAIG